MHLYHSILFVHVITVVFMAAPLYNLIVVNERLQFGKAPFAVDRYFENLIRGNATRCFVYQLTVLISGILLIPLAGLPMSALYDSPVLLAKFLLVLLLSGLLSYVHLGIQPRIESLLAQVPGEQMAPEILQQIAPWRARRKRLAAICLFFVMTLVLLGLQIFDFFGWYTCGMLMGLSALFSWRVYKSPLRFGWI